MTSEVPSPNKPGEPRKGRGRPPATGRFETRAELLEAVWSDYNGTGRSTEQMGRAYGVSAAVINKILNTREGSPTTLPKDFERVIGPDPLKPGSRRLMALVRRSVPTRPVHVGINDTDPESTMPIITIPGEGSLRFARQIVLPDGLDLGKADKLLSAASIMAVLLCGHQRWYVVERTRFFFGNEQWAEEFSKAVREMIELTT